MTAPMPLGNQTSPALHIGRDRRRHKRVSIKLGGRFLNENSEDHGLVTQNLSCSGAMIFATVLPAQGSTIVCYFDDLGRVSCDVIRQTRDGFAVRFNVAEHKRDKLADRLTWLLNKDSLGLKEERETPRFAAGGPALVMLRDGRQLQCRVLDMSLTGASFESNGGAPMMGETVTAGHLKGRVVRVDDHVFAIEFIR